MFYAYVHALRSTTTQAEVFYVGKGTLVRARDVKANSRNSLYAKTVSETGIPLVGVIECSTEDIASELEKGLIKCLRRSGVILANITGGGDGSIGEPGRAKISAAHKGRIWSDSHRKNHALAIANSTAKKSPEFFARMSKVHKGKTIAAEVRLVLAERKLGRRWVTCVSSNCSKLVEPDEASDMVSSGSYVYGRHL